MADDDVGLVFVVRDTDFVEEEVGGLADHHGREELAAEPGSAARGDGLLNDGDADGGVFGEFVGTGEAGGACADDNDVGVSVGDHVRHVAAGHLSGDDGFADGLEAEGLEVVFGGDGWGAIWGRGGGGGNAGGKGGAEDGGEVMVVVFEEGVGFDES